MIFKGLKLASRGRAASEGCEAGCVAKWRSYGKSSLYTTAAGFDGPCPHADVVVSRVISHEYLLSCCQTIAHCSHHVCRFLQRHRPVRATRQSIQSRRYSEGCVSASGGALGLGDQVSPFTAEIIFPRVIGGVSRDECRTIIYIYEAVSRITGRAGIRYGGDDS